MLEIASQIILCLLLAALIGFILGYLFCKFLQQKDSCASGGGDAQSQAVVEASATTQEEGSSAGATQSSKPQVLSAPRGGKKDNLKLIRGIGVKIEQALNEQGIYHFDQSAGWSEENIKWVDENIAFPGRVKREQWVEQAKLLAEGKRTEFSQRVEAGEVSTSKDA